MKNIILLPTDKVSRLIKDIWKNTYSIVENFNTNHTDFKGCYMYITNDEYIGFSYYLDGDLVRKGVIDDKDYWSVRKEYKKIIMTNDPKLIKDGVQEIPDDFLKWFVDNSTCEFVETQDWYSKFLSCCQSKEQCYCNKKRIIIPKEEPKCTCKVGEIYNNTCCKVHGMLNDDFDNALDSFKTSLNKKYDDTKWDTERIIDLIQFLSMNEDFNGYSSVSRHTAKHFLEQFKKQ